VCGGGARREERVFCGDALDKSEEEQGEVLRGGDY